MARWLIVIAAALPGVVLATVTAVSGAEIFFSGEPLIFAARAANLAEAAASRDTADVVLRLALGEDVNRRTLVRIPQQSDTVLVLAPLEAAIVGQRASIVRLLVNNGAKVDRQTLLRARCFAQHRGGHGRIGDEETIAYLATLDPSPADCGVVSIPEM
jgi:hypothetical protein